MLPASGRGVSVARGRMNDCYRCEWYKAGDAGNICKMPGLGIFDVAAARDLLRRRRRRTVCISPRRLWRLLDAGGIYAPHLPHVNTRKAGIIARFAAPDGEVYIFILEGNHRAARAFLAGKRFRCYELTEEETAAVFLGRRAPNGSRYMYKGEETRPNKTRPRLRHLPAVQAGRSRGTSTQRSARLIKRRSPQRIAPGPRRGADHAH